MGESMSQREQDEKNERLLRLMTEVAERKAMKQESGEEPETDVSGEEPVN